MINGVEMIEETGGRTTPAATVLESLDSRRLRRLEVMCWVVAVMLGLLHAWASRHSMDGDGVSYLDMGEAWWRGDFGMAVNGYWSPLYSWLLGLALLALRPTSYWEFATAHLVNFLAYLAALAAFAFFLREVVSYQRGQAARLARGGWVSLPGRWWVVVGYVLFVWSSLELITLRYVTPDMLVAACVYGAGGLVVRIRREGEAVGWRVFAVLGLVLGVGYLAKAAMFPLAFVYLVVSMFAVGKMRVGMRRVAVAAGVLLMVGGPWIGVLSWSKGRVTFGDTGRLNYAWYVNDIPGVYWQGEPSGSGTPVHPTRKILDVPAVYEFARPVGGTYPHWYDPSYWCEGLRPRFNLGRHLTETLWRPSLYSLLFFSLRGGLVVSLFILFYMSGRGRSIIRDVASYWFVWVPGVAALGMYMQVHVEPRFIGAFVVVAAAGLFGGVRLVQGEGSRRLAGCIGVVMVAALALTVGPWSVRAARGAVRDVASGGGGGASEYWEVAEGLRQMGVHPGTKAAVLNTSIGPAGPAGNIRSSGNMRWARLAKVQIVAEVYSREGKNNFWAADEATRNRVVEAFARAEAKVIVDDAVPDWAGAAGWRRIGETDYHVYFLPQ